MGFHSGIRTWGVGRWAIGGRSTGSRAVKQWDEAGPCGKRPRANDGRTTLYGMLYHQNLVRIL
jgi:hypothetical protein